MRRAIILLAALIMVGCADERRFYRPGSTAEDFRTDSYACERDARAVSYSFGSGIMGGLEARNFERRCMGSKGWALR